MESGAVESRVQYFSKYTSFVVCAYQLQSGVRPSVFLRPPEMKADVMIASGTQSSVFHIEACNKSRIPGKERTQRNVSPSSAGTKGSGRTIWVTASCPHGLLLKPFFAKYSLLQDICWSSGSQQHGVCPGFSVFFRFHTMLPNLLVLPGLGRHMLQNSRPNPEFEVSHLFISVLMRHKRLGIGHFMCTEERSPPGMSHLCQLVDMLCSLQFYTSVLLCELTWHFDQPSSTRPGPAKDVLLTWHCPTLPCHCSHFLVYHKRYSWWHVNGLNLVERVTIFWYHFACDISN